MKEAKISEMFLSLQGEGIYLGIPQLFIRFYGCNLSCVFCDTNPESYKTFTRAALMSKILDYKKPYHSIALTGGEPLLQADFILDFLSEYKKFHKKRIYLETNGTLPKELLKVIGYIDTIAMDFKLSSSTRGAAFWREHEKFLKIAKTKDIFVKAVITSKTKSSDIMQMVDTVKRIDKNLPIVLQPVTSMFEGEKPTDQSIEGLRDTLKSLLGRVEVVPQVHKIIGVK